MASESQAGSILTLGPESCSLGRGDNWRESVWMEVLPSFWNGTLSTHRDLTHRESHIQALCLTVAPPPVPGAASPGLRGFQERPSQFSQAED